MKFFANIFLLVLAASPLCALGVHGVITERIAVDIGSVNVTSSLPEAAAGSLEVSRMAFALGRLSGEDKTVLRSVRADGEGYVYTMSDGVICRVSGNDLRSGKWSPREVNVPEVPRPVRRASSNGTVTPVLMLKPCSSL